MKSRKLVVGAAAVLLFFVAVVLVSLRESPRTPALPGAAATAESRGSSRSFETGGEAGPESGEADGETASGAMAALQYWAKQRAYPGTSLAGDGFARAFEYSRRNLREAGISDGRADQPDRSGQGAKAVTSWRQLGPHNIGGRTLAVALNPQNPNTVYAGSASGGLWRSTTGGVGAAAWDYVFTGHPVLGVSSIAIDPADSNVMYIGTGEVYSYDDTQGGIAVRLTRGSFGIGVLKTVDGGDTWTKSLDWSYDQQRGVWSVRIDPTNPDVVWAGTTEGTYKSINGGDSWTRVHDVIMVNDLVIHPTNSDTVFTACGNLESAGHGLYRTLDGGASWTKIVAGGAIPASWDGKAQLSICESQPSIVMASIGNGGVGSYATWLVRSEDNGDSWVRVSSQDYSQWQGWFSHDVAINPEDPSEVVTCGIDIWKSMTGGSSLVKKSDWTLWYFGQTIPGEPEGPPTYSHADHHDLVYHPSNRDIIYFGNDGGVFRSLDGGETFEGCNGGYQTQQFYPGFSCSQTDSNLAMGGMQDNSTAIYDGTNAWIRVIGGDGSWTAIDPANNLTIFGSYQYCNILKSTNQGGGFFGVSPPANGSVSFIAPYATGGVAEHLIMYAGRSYIYRSTTGGVGWVATNGGAQLSSNPALSLAVSQTNSDVVYVTMAPVNGPAQFFRTTNAGVSWDNVTGTLPDRYLVGLAIDPTDDQTLYVTASGFGSSHAFKSTNRGDGWQDIGAGLPDVPTSAVVVDPFEPGHVYIGNDIGVYVSFTGGGNWQEYRVGLPDAVVCIDLDVSASDGMLRLATHGNGVFERPLLSTVIGVPDVTPAVAFELGQNHPNPFNPYTDIHYHLFVAGEVELTIFDAAGRRVRSLLNESRPAGDHSVRWDGRDDAGMRAASGTYLYELRFGNEVQTRKMILVK